LDGLSNEVITILGKIKEEVADDSDIIWTSYESPLELRNEIDRCVYHLQQNNKKILEEINFHFAPTGIFQELSMTNGSSGKYHILTEHFDKLYVLLIKYN